MSVTITGMTPNTFAGDTGYAIQQIVGGLVIEPPTTGAGTGGAVPLQVQLGPLAILTPTLKIGPAYTVSTTETVTTFNGAGTITVTLPSAAAYPGRVLVQLTVAAQAVNSATSNVVPANSTSAGTAILAATAGKWAILVSNGTTWQIVANN